MFQKIRAVIVGQITQGATPHGLALTSAFAVSLGLFPLIGSTTILCFVFALIFRLNQPLIQSLNYLMFPIQILFMPVFLYIGETILQVPHITINPADVVRQFSEDPRLSFTLYGMAGLHAILAWVLIAPIIGTVLYFPIRFLLQNFSRRLQ